MQLKYQIILMPFYKEYQAEIWVRKESEQMGGSQSRDLASFTASAAGPRPTEHVVAVQGFAV